MATSTKSLSYGVTDCKIAVLTDDPAGGSPTYATDVDVPGVTKINVKIAVETAQLRGDDTVLDERSTITGVEAELENAKMSLDVLAALYSGTVSTTGTTPDEIASWDLTATSRPQHVRIRTVNAAADPTAGGLHFTLHKAMPRGVDGLGAADKAYTSPKTSFGCSALLSTGKWFTPAIYETAPTL